MKYPSMSEIRPLLRRPKRLDNVVRDGQVIDSASADTSVLGTRAAFDWIGSHPRLRASALQTVGAKGWDGFAIMLVD